MLLLPLLAIPLASCATMTGSGGIEAPPDFKSASFCTLAKPISWSAKDTAETVGQIKQHNAVWTTLCQGGK